MSEDFRTIYRILSILQKFSEGKKTGPLKTLGGVIESCFRDATIIDGSATIFGKSVSNASEMLIRKFGSNASGVCGVDFRDVYGGTTNHAFNWSIKDGVVTFFDGQNSKSLINMYPDRIWKSIVRDGSLTLARLDNATIIKEVISTIVE